LISVTITRKKSGDLSTLEVTGHDFTAPSGSNVVCAGASAIVQSFLIGAIEVLGIDARLDVSKGRVLFEIGVEPLREKARGLELLLDTMVATLLALEDRYPESKIELKDTRGVLRWQRKAQAV
jgi:uncharacterized protein